MKNKHDLIVVGDRVLIKPEAEMDKTHRGLYLPQGVKEKEKVQAGTVVKVGPGYPIPDPSQLSQESWKKSTPPNTPYFPLESRPGDYVLFLRDSAVEVEFEGSKYLVAPHAAILLIVRDHLTQALNELANE